MTSEKEYNETRGDPIIGTIATRPFLSPAPTDEGVRPRRWTREEYYRAAELGLFRPEERLELLDGEILTKMSPQKAPHAVSVTQAGRVAGVAFGPAHHVRHQLPIILNDVSEPEPDVVVGQVSRLTTFAVTH